MKFLHRFTLVLLTLSLLSGGQLFAQQSNEPPLPEAEPLLPPSALTFDLAATPAPVNTIQTDFPELENQAINIINNLRQENGQNCLFVAESLRNSAYEHSKDMHDRNFFNFTNPDGQSPTDRASEKGYTGNVGEGITAGADGIRDTPEEAIADLRSERTNYHNVLLAAGAEDIGVGFFRGPDNFQDYWTVDIGAGEPTTGDGTCPERSPITDIPFDLTISGLDTLLPTFTWKRSTDPSRVPATFYDVAVVNPAGSTSSTRNLIRPPRASGTPLYSADEFCTGDTCSVKPDSTAYSRPIADGTTYTFWVRAYSEAGGYTWSAIEGFTFTIDSSGGSTPTATVTETPTPTATETPTATPTEPSSGVERIYPANGQTIANRTQYQSRFQWRPVEGAEWYNIYLATPDYMTFVYNEWYEASAVCEGDVCTIPNNFENQVWLPQSGEYVLWIGYWSTSIGDAFADTYTESRFTVTMGSPVASLIDFTPTGVVTDRSLTLRWRADPNVLWYRIWVGPATYDANLIFNWYDASAICGETDCTLTAEGISLGNNDYEVWMQTWGPGGFLDWFRPSSFTVAG